MRSYHQTQMTEIITGTSQDHVGVIVMVRVRRCLRWLSLCANFTAVAVNSWLESGTKRRSATRSSLIDFGRDHALQPCWCPARHT